jgi:hypothetical protein
LEKKVMRKLLSICAVTVSLSFSAALCPLQAADDWSFIAGTYAVEAGDCKAAGDNKAFSDALVAALSQDVLTREGITSPREVHCKFKGVERADGGWTVKSSCEEMGEGAPADLKVTANADGSLAVSNEDVWGPDPQVFKLCQK